MEELIRKLNEAAEAYYNGEEIMSNFEYDKLYDALVVLEEQAGYSLPGSPTQKVGVDVVDDIPKAKHEFPALSLAKTKDVDEFCQRLAEHVKCDAHMKVYNKTISNDVITMWKMDGSTIVLTYDKGHLVSCVTRGNGDIGGVITHNAPYMEGVPLTIPYEKCMIVRGEAVMSYTEFDRINQNLPPEEQYKNPRNLANATISLLDSREMRKRKIVFHAFELVYMDDPMPAFFEGRMKLLKEYGIHTVDFTSVHYSKLKEELERWTGNAPSYEFPVDGLVCALNDCGYSDNLPGTGHNPNIAKGYALKWEDETAKTILRDIEWSASRTGLLNPVAIFDPVELEGTTVTRASVHNLSTVIDLGLKVGDRILVYKANKIIPQIAENIDAFRDGYTVIPAKCPVCGGQLSTVRGSGNTKVLTCPNPDCAAKQTGRFVHFCERDCMNIMGMSEATIEKFVNLGIIKEFADFYKLSEHPEIAQMEGFGEKSWKKMCEAAETSRQSYDFVGLIHSLGIPNVGKGQAKLLKKAVENWAQEMYPEYEMSYFDTLARMSESFDFTSIEGFGSVIASSLDRWITENMQKNTEFMKLLEMLPIRWIPQLLNRKENNSENITGKTFVITGSVSHFKNRDELKDYIESLGGKTAGSVSTKTDYLINNDNTSQSSKNKKAKELGIPVITEEDFLKMV